MMQIQSKNNKKLPSFFKMKLLTNISHEIIKVNQHEGHQVVIKCLTNSILCVSDLCALVQKYTYNSMVILII